MQNDGSDGTGVTVLDHIDPSSDLEKQGNMVNLPQFDGGGGTSFGQSVDNGGGTQTVVNNGESHNHVPVIVDATTPKKGCLSRNESSRDQCRVCQQQTEESLIDLGCRCRGGLAKAHHSCIDTWFRVKGSNKCEICQQIAINVPSPDSQPSHTNYWVWMAAPVFRGYGIAQTNERVCLSPLWVAFSILIGGLLLDVLISITFGVSALPVNIIIGVLVVLGLGTALRLALECCHGWSLRSAVQRMDTNLTFGYHPTV